MRILTTIFLLFPVFLLISQGCTTKSTSGVNDVTDTIVTTERRFTFLTDSIDDKNFPEWLVQNKFTYLTMLTKVRGGRFFISSEIVNEQYIITESSIFFLADSLNLISDFYNCKKVENDKYLLMNYRIDVLNDTLICRIINVVRLNDDGSLNKGVNDQIFEFYYIDSDGKIEMTYDDSVLNTIN